MNFAVTCFTKAMSPIQLTALCILLTSFNHCRKAIPVSGQDSFRILAKLPPKLTETSGLAPAGAGTVYVHNDSGNLPELYEINPGNAQIIRTIRISGRRNTDWEELAWDSSFLYIGDFGNNSGRRKDLMILKVSRAEIVLRDTVPAGLISFHYPEQTRIKAGRAHNFDCEAMIAMGDSLYLFTKNRGDLGTDIYRLPADTGTYAARHTGHFNTRGLVTAADHGEATRADHGEERGLARRLVRPVEPRRAHDHGVEPAPHRVEPPPSLTIVGAASTAGTRT